MCAERIFFDKSPQRRKHRKRMAKATESGAL